MMKNALVIMAKVPVAGNVKTRLQPFLSAEQCAELAACFLRDTVNKTNALKIRPIIAFSPPEHRSLLVEILNGEYEIIEQCGKDLGARMFNAFQFAFEQNADSVVMIGTDSPTFPPEFIERAFESLSKNDAVLGKTIDGGFYLIGLRDLREEIFEGVEWSSPKTFEQTRSNIEKLNLKLASLPDWYDVDTADDLRILRADLAKNSNSAPLTNEFIKKI